MDWNEDDLCALIAIWVFLSRSLFPYLSSFDRLKLIWTAKRTALGGPHPEHQLANPCVLVVEDEFLVRWQMAEVLRSRGFNVFEFATADDAWTFLQSGARVDVVFTDIRLPGNLNGLELVRLIYENLVPIKAAVVTSSHLPEGAIPLPVPFVSKPYDPDATAELLSKFVYGY